MIVKLVIGTESMEKSKSTDNLFATIALRPPPFQIV